MLQAVLTADRPGFHVNEIAAMPDGIVSMVATANDLTALAGFLAHMENVNDLLDLQNHVVEEQQDGLLNVTATIHLR